jgi:hypothetical protein
VLDNLQCLVEPSYLGRRDWRLEELILCQHVDGLVDLAGVQRFVLSMIERHGQFEAIPQDARPVRLFGDVEKAIFLHELARNVGSGWREGGRLSAGGGPRCGSRASFAFPLLSLCLAIGTGNGGIFFLGGGFSLSEKEKEEEKKECVLEGVLSGVGQTDTEPAFEWRSGEVSCGGMAEKKTLLSCLSDTTPSAIACHHIYILFRMARYGGCKLVGSTQCSNQNVGA